MRQAGLPMKSLTGQDHKIWDIVQGSCDESVLEEILCGDEAAVSLVQDYWTPLHFVCENHNLKHGALSVLLRANADVNATDDTGCTALHLLSQNKAVTSGLLQELVTGGAGVDAALRKNGKTPLHLLCENEAVSSTMIGTLLQGGANASKLDTDKNTPLHKLCSNQRISVESLSLLLDRGRSNPNDMNRFEATPFHYLCQNGSLSPTLVEICLKSGADPNKPDNISCTPFQLACQNSQLTEPLLGLFLTRGQAEIMWGNSSGKTSMDYIASSGKKDCIKLAMQYAPTAVYGRKHSSSSNIPGGEDLSNIPPENPLWAELKNWNSSLPPFAQDFYRALTCDPSCQDQYERLQDISLGLLDSPGDTIAFCKWKECLAQWRRTIVTTYASLMHPNSWAQHQKTFQRSIPRDLLDIKARALRVWEDFPGSSGKMHRLEKIMEMVA